MEFLKTVIKNKTPSNPRLLVLFLDVIIVKFRVDRSRSFLSNAGMFIYV